MTHRLVTVLALVLGVPAGPAAAQEPVVAYNGVEIFCHILHYLGFEPIRDAGTLRRADPEETLIVVFGDTSRAAELRGYLGDPDAFAWLIGSDLPSGRIVKRGKKDLLLVDPIRDAWKLDNYGKTVSVALQFLEQNQALAYQGIPRCPMLNATLDAKHPIFRGIKLGIATNRPTTFQSHKSDLLRLAGFPPECRHEDGVDLQRQDLGLIFGTAAADPRRVLVIGNQGIFINGMLVQYDNDNLLFTLNSLRWLQDGKRKYAVVWTNNEFVQRFDLPLTAPQGMPIPPVQVLNQMIRELENENIVNRFLMEQVGPDNIFRIALLIATAGLVLYGAKRLLGARHTQETAPLIVGQTESAALARPAFLQRQQEMLLQDNLWEAAQGLVSGSENGPAPTCRFGTKPTPRRPPIRSARAFGRAAPCVPKSSSCACAATSDPSRPVSLRGFRRLLEVRQTLDQAVSEGALVFSSGERGPRP